MDATQLRIGSKLQIGSTEITVSELYTDEFKTPEEGTITYSHRQLSGIPLTAELLERCGFENCPPVFANNSNPYWAKDGIVLTYSTAPPENTYHPGIGFTHNGEYLVANSKVWITTLHELQNFYKENRGTELTIKP